MNDHHGNMRIYMDVSSTEDTSISNDEPIFDIEYTDTVLDDVIHDLELICFKLSSFTQNSNSQDFNYGFESGLNMAEDMIRRVIRKYQD